jgi:FkbM family methyltransferase
MLRSLPVPGRWRIAPLLNRLFPIEPVEASMQEVGRFHFDLSDNYQMEMFWAGLQRDDALIVRLMRAALPPDGVFLDVGANVGIHTLAAAKLVAAGGGAVVGFEPHPQNFRTLTDNVNLNGLRHVAVHQLGLAEAADVLICKGPPRGNWSLASREGVSFEVRLVSLDDHLEEHPLPRLDMIKMDVEGAEVRVLQGARETIARFQPLIVFEMCPAWLRRMNTSPAELLATLQGFGYVIHPLPTGRPIWGSAITSADSFNDWGPAQWTNLVAVPPRFRQTPSPSQVVQKSAPARADVLTDVPGKPGRFWGDHTTCVGPTKPPRWLSRCLGSGLAHDVTGALAGARLFMRRSGAAGVVTDGGASGVTFALLQRLVPWGRKPHVMIDCLWNEASSAWKRWAKKKRLQLTVPAVTRYVVWANHEVEDYARAFDLPLEKLQYVPFHTTIHDYEYEIRDDGYLFAGGNSDRDYPTLVEAVRDLDVPAWIATTQPELLAGVAIPAHVRVEGTSVQGFRQAMAAARLVVIPLQAGLLHSAGQQTCLNAMFMGKPTIAIGRKWATDFITDGVDGLIVDYSDAAGLRRAIRWVLDHPAAAREMGERARERAAWFTTDRTMRSVYRIAKGEPCEQHEEQPHDELVAAT